MKITIQTRQNYRFFFRLLLSLGLFSFCQLGAAAGLNELSGQNKADNYYGLHQQILHKAQQYIGTPYLYGGVSPSGFDCSGFINFLYGEYIQDLPRRSQDFVRYGEKAPFNKLRPGDLLLFATTPGSNKITHVSLYMGKGKVIHAISAGSKTGIQISDASQGYWNRHLRYARRILSNEINGNLPSTTTAVLGKE